MSLSSVFCITVSSGQYIAVKGKKGPSLINKDEGDINRVSFDYRVF